MKFLSQKKLIPILILLLFLCFYNYLFPSPSSPNLIIISIDSLRPDHMSLYGYTKNTTPHIDSFAHNATIFTNTRTIVPMTYPSFTSLMTGKDPFVTRISRNYGDLISDNNFTIATILKQNGYNTAAFTTGGLSGPSTNLDHGFSQFSFFPYKYHEENNGKTLYKQTNRKEYEQFLENSINWLRENNKQKFFFWVHLMDPHAPYAPPDNYKCAFNNAYCQTTLNQTEGDLELQRSEFQSCQKNPLSKDKIELQETLYDGGIAYTDSLVNNFIQTITEEKLDKNSIIVILSDHGEGFDHNYYFDHRAVLYESALKIPLIIKTPSQKKGAKSDQLIQNNDIFRTLLDLLNAKYPQNMSTAVSFESALTSGFNPFAPKRQVAYFTNHNFTKFAVLDNEYKYIYSLNQSCLLNGQTEELYNIQSDSQEMANLVLSDPNRAKKLKNKLLDYLSLYNLPLVPNNSSLMPTNSQDLKYVDQLPY